MDNHIPENDSRLLRAVRWLFAAVMAVILGLLYNEALFMLAALVIVAGACALCCRKRIGQPNYDRAVCIILPLCLVSIGVYALHGALPLRESVPYLIGGAAGGVAAGLLFSKMPARILHLALGALIVFGGVRLLVC